MQRILFFLLMLCRCAVWGAEIDAEAIARKCTSSVMLIVADGAGKSGSLGTAFTVSADGKLVTNFHVIEGKDRLTAKSQNGGLFLVKSVLAIDKEHDLALLQIEARNLPFLELGDSASINSGAGVVVIGNPIGLEASVTQGIISAKRVIDSQGEILQISAAISPGSSGSPVFNAQGKVVGVATFKLVKGESLNFAIPSSHVASLLSRPANAADTKSSSTSSRVTGLRKGSREQDETVLNDQRFKDAKNSEKNEDYVALLRSARILVGEFQESALAERMLSDAYFYMEMKKDCLEHARIALDLDPKSARAWNNLAIALRTADDENGAVSAYEEALKLAPDDAKVLAEYAAITASSRPSGAESAARHALKLLLESKGLDAETTIYPPYAAVAHAFMRLGKADDAYRAAIEGVKKMPNWRRSWESLASAAIATKQFDAVPNIVERGRNESKGNDAYLYWMLATAKAEQKQFALAHQALRRAYAANQNRKEVLRDLVLSLLLVSPRVVPQDTLAEIYDYTDHLKRLDAEAGRELMKTVEQNLKAR